MKIPLLLFIAILLGSLLLGLIIPIAVAHIMNRRWRAKPTVINPRPSPWKSWLMAAMFAVPVAITIGLILHWLHWLNF